MYALIFLKAQLRPPSIKVLQTPLVSYQIKKQFLGGSFKGFWEITPDLCLTCHNMRCLCARRTSCLLPSSLLQFFVSLCERTAHIREWGLTSDNQISLFILMFDRYVALSSSVNLTELLKGQCVPYVYCHSHLCPTKRRVEHNKVKSHCCRSSVLGWVLSKTIHSPSPRFLAIKQAQQ